MASDPSDIWSPQQGTTTFTDTFSPTRQSYTSQSDVQRFSSDGEDPAEHTRRLIVSPTASYTDDIYSDDNSLEEVDATLNNLDDEIDDAEQALTEWSGSYSSGRPTYSTGTGTFTGSYSATYTGSPSFVSLPTFSPRSPFQQTIDPRARLSRITEKTEESRPSSMAASAANFSRPANPTPDTLRRSALLGGGSASHSRASIESGSDPTLPPPGRLNELRAVFESPSPAGPRAASTPGFRSSSPMFGTTSLTSATGYGYGSTSYASRPSSPSKSGTGSSGSYTGPSLLSPPPSTRPTTITATSRTGVETLTSPSNTAPSYTSYTATPSYTATVTPSTFSATNTNTWSNTHTQTRTGYTTPNLTTGTYSEDDTFTRTSVTPPSGLRRPQTSPRSPLASVRNIVALWKERTPAAARLGDKSVAESVSSVSPPIETDGLQGVRRRVEGARARLREARAVSNPLATPTRQEDDPTINRRNSAFPPGIDLSELTGYTKSTDPPIHIGLLWYLNVHASPPYRWQRCQALLYPHMLLLSWLAPGGGRGIVALDLLNCTKAQSAYSPLHPLARDDVGTIAASQQTNERDGQSLVDILVPFQMLYADGVERLAAESLLERQKWVNRIMDSIHPHIAVPDSASITRSPTGSIRTILSIDSSSSQSSNGSRSTVFVPPLSTLPDISDFQSNTSAVSRRSSFASSYHSQTVDDMVIQNQEYVYRGDPRVITPSRGSSMRRSGSMTDLDEAFKSAVKGGDRPRSDVSDEHFFSAGSSNGTRSNVSSTYYSQTSITSMSGLRTATNLISDNTLTALTSATSETQVPTTFTPSSYRLTESSFRSGDSDVSFADSPSTLSRAREIRRRVGASRSYSSGYQTEASQSNDSDKENDEDISGTRTPTGSYTYTPLSYGASLNGSGSGSGGYTDNRSRTPTGSERSSRSGSGSLSGSLSGGYPGSGSGSGSYTPGSGSYSGSGSFTPASGSYTPGSGSYVPGSGSYTPGSSGYTPGSGSYTLQAASSSGVGGATPISSSETGYDVCPSSDFTDLTRPTTESETVTPITRSSDTLSDVASEKYVTASAASTEFLTAVVQSSRASITSFESFPTIPGSDSEYATADSGSSTDYHTASEPTKSPRRLSPESAYITADAFSIELGDIPSEASTPTLSSLRLGSEPDDMRSLVQIPSVVPSIKSPTISLMSELLPEEIPLPASIHSPSIRAPSIEARSSSPSVHSPSVRAPSVESRSLSTPSLHISPPVAAPSILSELLPEEVPLPASIGSPSVISELLPEEIPLPPSVRVATDRPLPPLPLPSLSVSDASTPFVPSPPSVSVPALSTSLSSVSSVSSLSIAQPSPPSPSLPPLPLSTPSASLALSPSLERSLEVSDVRTPSSLHIIPSSSPSSPDDDEEDRDSEDELTVSLSLLPTLPDSSLGTTSVATPSSLALSSVSSTSTLPPSTVVISRTTVLPRPESMSTISSGGLSSFTQTSSSILPPGPEPWASVTNISYESSVLHPSPSVQSIALQEVDASFETSFLRPSGSASSVNRMSTIPGSPSPLTSAPPQSPLQPLTPVPVLPPSVSSSTDVATPTSMSLSTASSSSLGRTLSTYSSSSFMSQSSLNSSVFDSRSLQFEIEPEEEPEEEPEQEPVQYLESELAMPDPSTEPSLLSLLPSSSTPTPLSSMTISMPSHSSSPVPPPVLASFPSSSSMMTPSGSLAVSITTPQGSGDTEQSSLRTVPSDSAVTQRDLGHEIDRLADELRTYDRSRGLENQDIIDNVRNLRDELRDLADFLRRTPSPSSSPVQSERQETPVPHRTVHLVDASAGRSTSISLEQHFLPLPPAAPISLSRATSNASSFVSYLSSHHSDDDVFDEELNYTDSSPQWVSEVDDGDAPIDSQSSTSSGSTSLGPSSPEWPPTEPLPELRPPSIQYEPSRERSLTRESPVLQDSPVPPESPLPPESLVRELPLPPQSPVPALSEASTVRPPVDLLRSLESIGDQLQALENGQGNARALLRSLLDRPEDPTVELADRLRRIEDLVQTLVDQRHHHPRGPEIAPDVPYVPIESAASLVPEGSTSDTDSLDHLSTILRTFTRDGPIMPIPVTARQGPTMLQQLDEILSSGPQLPVVGIEQPPNVDPFVYRPVERGRRARSESPVSINFTRRTHRPPTVPFVPVRPAHTERRPTSEVGIGTTSADSSQQLPSSTQAPDFQRPQEGQQTVRPIGRHFPTPVPVIPRLYDERTSTAPPTLGRGDAPQLTSWYHPGPGRQRTQQAQPHLRPPATNIPNQQSGGPQSATQSQEPNVQYVPMPPGPMNINLPPVFQSLMEILTENRLAQLATVDQQRELMRYMRGLNEWLERDVYDRQSELQGVVARVEQLSHDIRGIRAQAASSSSESDDTVPTIYQSGPGFSQPGPGFPQPVHHLDPRFQQPPPRYPPVIPPVVPETTGYQGPVIPPQPFPPASAFPQPQVFPHPQPFPQPITVTTLPQRIPPFPLEQPGPSVGGRRPSDGGSIFIPPDLSPPSRHSTGEPRPTLPPRPYPTDLGPNVYEISASTSSSGGSSTDTSRRGRRASFDSRPISRTDSRHRHTRTSRTPSPIRSSRPDSRPLVVTNPSAVPEVVPDPHRLPEQYPTHQRPPSSPTRHSVHVIPPSMSPVSSHYDHYPERPQPQVRQEPQVHFRQPEPEPQVQQLPQMTQPLQTTQPQMLQPAPTTIIVQPSPSQPVVQQLPMSPMPMGPSYHPPLSEAESIYRQDRPITPMTPMTPTPVVMPPPTMSMPPPTMGMPPPIMGMPPSNMGMPPPIINTGIPPSAMPMAPYGPSMAPMPIMQPMHPGVIIPTSSRSSSRSRHHRRTPPPAPSQPAAPIIINQEPQRTPPSAVQPSGAPVVVVPSGHHSPRRSRSPVRRYSSPSHPPVMLQQPGPMYPGPMSQVPQPVMMGPGPPVILPRPGSSRSSSRTPRREQPTIIPMQPTYLPRSSRYDDYSPSSRRRHHLRSRYSSSSRSPTDRRRPRRRHDSSVSPPHTRHRHDYSSSPHRSRRRYSSSSPSRRGHRRHSSSSPSHRSHRRYSSSSPPRRSHRRYSSSSPPHHSHRRDSSISPLQHRHRRGSSRSPPHRHDRDLSISPPHRRTRSSHGDTSRYGGTTRYGASGSPLRYYPHTTGVGPSGVVPIPLSNLVTQYPTSRRSSRSSSSPRHRPPRIEVLSRRPSSPYHRIPTRYDPRDGSPDHYDSRGRSPDRDSEHRPHGYVSSRRRSPRDVSSRGRSPRDVSSRGQSPGDVTPRRRSPGGVSSRRRFPRDVRDDQTHPSEPRDMSVSTGRSPSPIPRRTRGESTISGPYVPPAVRGKSPTDITTSPIHRPLSEPEHKPVIIQVPSRSEAALHRPPPSRPLDETPRAHTPAVSHIDHEEPSSADRPMRPVRDSTEDHDHLASTFGEGSRRSDSTHRVHYDSRRPSFESEGSRRSPHPEVHRVHDDSQVARPPLVPIPTSTPTRPPTTAERSGSVHVPRTPSQPPTSAEHSGSVHVPRTPSQPHTTAERPDSVHVPRQATATPFDLGAADDDRGRLEALNEVAERLHSTLTIAQSAEERREVEFLAQEDRREEDFRHHEGDRQHYFEEAEERRNAEARQRSDGIWQDLETRLKALPAPVPIPQLPTRPASAVDADEISSIRDLAQQAASQHANDVMETIRLEREEAANEREALAAERAQLMAEISAQKDAVISEKDARITILEDELTKLRAELEEERQQRVTESSEMREREREELIERDENIRAQLADITNLVQDQHDMYETKKALTDARWEQKEARREDKNAQMIELRDMVQKIHDDMERDRTKCEDERRETQDTLQKNLDELRAENAQQQELLRTLSEGWRADCERHHQETIEAVRSTANEQVSFNVQGYLDDFSRALATEVRMLLGEVGRIREERRALQHEIGELLCIKSKYGPGGEFEPDWRPPGQPPAAPQPPTDPPMPEPEPTEPPVFRPAWRIYHPRTKKKKKEPKAAPVAAMPSQPPQAGPSHMDRRLRQQVTTSWSTWHPDPDTVLTPPSVEPTLMVPDRLSPGLFGPRTPSSSIYEEPGPQRR